MSRFVSALFVLVLFAAVNCGDDSDNNNSTSSGNGSGGSGLTDETGETCSVAGDCYGDVMNGELQGDAQCLDRVEGGYCTHLCVDDDDCCAADGECGLDDKQVCGPFESSGMMMCFISCESEDVGDLEPDDFCAGFHRDFICRSTGGGAANRKVCVPGGGGTLCSIVDDCTVDFPNCCDDAFGDQRCYTDVDAETRDCL